MFWPGSLAFPQISAPRAPPRPLFSPLSPNTPNSRPAPARTERLHGRRGGAGGGDAAPKKACGGGGATGATHWSVVRLATGSGMQLESESAPTRWENLCRSSARPCAERRLHGAGPAAAAGAAGEAEGGRAGMTGPGPGAGAGPTGARR